MSESPPNAEQTQRYFFAMTDPSLRPTLDSLHQRFEIFYRWLRHFEIFIVRVSSGSSMYHGRERRSSLPFTCVEAVRHLRRLVVFLSREKKKTC